MNTNIIKSWFLPLAIAVLMFAVARPALAQLIDSPVSDVEVGEEVRDGFSTIFYVDKGSRNYISQKAQNSKSPYAKGEYIVWVTEIADRPGQVFLYNIPSSSLVQLTSSGPNQNPKVLADGRVVWQGWVGEAWQIFFFDGKSVKQLTKGDVSVNPEVEGDYISFARQDVTGTWRSVVYSISKGEFKDVSTGTSSKKMAVLDGKIVLKGTGEDEEFPLTVDDLFLLDFAPFTREEATPAAEVTQEEIIEEINASASAQVEQGDSSPASEATPTPAP